MIIVTGGAGFIGSCMVKALNDLGKEEILIVDRLGTGQTYRNLIGLKYLDYVDKDEFLEQISEGMSGEKVEAVIHLGACSSTTEFDADYLMQNNYRYSQALALWCDKYAVRYIYASSAATYGAGEQGYCDEAELIGFTPLNPYGYSKHAFDLWMERQGLLQQMAGLKFFNVYGPREDHKEDMRSVVNKAYEQIQATGVVKLFKSHRAGFADGEQKRDFVYVKDACAVILFLLEKTSIGGIFNVGSGQARTFKDLATQTFLALGKEPNIVYIDMPEHLRDKYQYFTEATMDKLRRAGYSQPPTPLEEGVKDYVQTYLQKR